MALFDDILFVYMPKQFFFLVFFDSQKVLGAQERQRRYDNGRNGKTTNKKRKNYRTFANSFVPTESNSIKLDDLFK